MNLNSVQGEGGMMKGHIFPTFFCVIFWFFNLVTGPSKCHSGFLVDDGEKNKIHSLWQYGYCLIGAVPLNPSLALLKAFAQYFQYLFND